jgi:hypothetical protein
MCYFFVGFSATYTPDDLYSSCRNFINVSDVSCQTYMNVIFFLGLEWDALAFPSETEMGKHINRWLNHQRSETVGPRCT